MNSKILPILFGAMLYCSLSFAQNNNLIAMKYEETVCPPEWISIDNDNTTLKNLTELLAKESIEVFDAKYTGKRFEQTCEGCQCPTGRKIQIKIKFEDQERLKIWGMNYIGYNWERVYLKN